MNTEDGIVVKFNYKVDENTISYDAMFDGVYVISTNEMELDELEMIETYKGVIDDRASLPLHKRHLRIKANISLQGQKGYRTCVSMRYCLFTLHCNKIHP
jgi:hypothetical protein